MGLTDTMTGVSADTAAAINVRTWTSIAILYQHDTDDDSPVPAEFLEMDNGTNDGAVCSNLLLCPSRFVIEIKRAISQFQIAPVRDLDSHTT